MRPLRPARASRRPRSVCGTLLTLVASKRGTTAFLDGGLQPVETVKPRRRTARSRRCRLASIANPPNEVCSSSRSSPRGRGRSVSVIVSTPIPGSCLNFSVMVLFGWLKSTTKAAPPSPRRRPVGAVRKDTEAVGVAQVLREVEEIRWVAADSFAVGGRSTCRRAPPSRAPRRPMASLMSCTTVEVRVRPVEPRIERHGTPSARQSRSRWRCPRPSARRLPNVKPRRGRDVDWGCHRQWATNGEPDEGRRFRSWGW